MAKTFKQWVVLQKEGLIVGAIWGALSIYASAGLASTQTGLVWWQKILIAPVYITGLFAKNMAPSDGLFLVVVLVGAGIGALIDSIYRPET